MAQDNVNGAVNGSVNGNVKGKSYPLADHAIDDYRPIKVICIGAGISGILTGIRFPQKIPNLDLVIYEKNEDVGGTWFENHYPGLRCDIPIAAYQYSFEPNSQWSEYYCKGPEILQYLKRVAKKYGAYKYMKFKQYFQGAKWIAEKGLWEVTIKDLITGEIKIDTANFLVKATGILNKWDWPNIPGLNDFEGKLIHSAEWEDSFDLEGKNVALIGAGSSGIQILPTIQPIAKRIDHYMKGKNWISPIGYGGDELPARGIGSGNFYHSEEELKTFKAKPESYHEYRHRVESYLNKASLVLIHGSPEQKAFQNMTEESMREKLLKKPEIYEALQPSFPPGCRRLIPGPGYLEALVQDNVSFISTGIKQIIPEGIETVDGIIRKVDVIICATGYDTTLIQEVPIIGRNGIDINTAWDPMPDTYLSIFPPDMPNFFLYLGPNGGPGSGSTYHSIEAACGFMIKCIQKLQLQYIQSMVVRPKAVAEFGAFVDRYFARTIFAQKCRSWFKRGQEEGRIVAAWPGSALQEFLILQNPRWEDFIYEMMPETEENSLSWYGNGLTYAQQHGGHTTKYLDEVDFPPVVDPVV